MKTNLNKLNYDKAYKEKEKELLSDYYIISLFKANKMSYTAQDILNKRNILLEKRNLVKNNLQKCIKCKELKLTKYFAYQSKSKKSGKTCLKTVCKNCFNQYKGLWIKKRPDITSKRNKLYALTYPEKIKEYNSKQGKKEQITMTDSYIKRLIRKNINRLDIVSIKNKDISSKHIILKRKELTLKRKIESWQKQQQ